ncbi:right-handed parallel beta-helix repeat-containing protein [Streptomyces sp. NPDC088147]|uniref:right-handed parallel beta-helix repeat-containing protein n=1 Tax=Streptomyces sp. NPDC088147 TaxID=3365830 RepID=UPI003805ECD2
MAIYTYGGTPSDVLTTATGGVLPDCPVTVRVAGTGELITALYEADGTTPIGALRSNPASHPAPGAVRTFKIDGIAAIEYEYLDAAGRPVRRHQAAREAATRALEHVQGTFDTTTTPGPLAAARFGSSGQSLFDVTAFGAKGDGIADDTTPIQATLDAAYNVGGGSVLFPGGRTYNVSTFMVVRANTTVWAYGASIRSTHATTGVLRNFYGTDVFDGYGGHSHIKILGGTWDCNAYSASLGTGIVTATTNTMCFIHCADITVRDCRLLDSSSAHALEFNAVKGAVVEACRFEGFIDNSGDGSRRSSEAVQIDIAKSGSSSIGAFDGTPAVDIRVSGCWFGPSARLGTFGRAIGSHAQVAARYFDDIVIENCVIEGALESGIRGWNWRRAKIRGNTVRDTAASGVHVSVPDPAAGTVYTSYGITITDNIIEGTRTGSGIRVLGYDTAPITDVVINNNTIRGAAATTANGIQPQCTPGAVVSGNTVDGVRSTGIFPQYSDGVNLTGNTLTNTFSNAVNVAGCTAASVTDNVVDTTGSNHGIVIGGGTDGRAGAGALVAGNRIRAAAVAGIRLSQSGCHITGNKVMKGSGTTVNGVSLTSAATGCVITGNDLSGNGWTVAAALLTSTAAPVVTANGGTVLPGSNLVHAIVSNGTLATVADTTTETAIATVTIPGNDPQPGSAYRVRVYGTASTTATPTLGFGLKIGGTVVAAPATVTARSGVSGKGWMIEAVLHCVGNGVSGTWAGGLTLMQQYGTTSVVTSLSDGAITNDTTTDMVVAVTAKWSSAGASNTATATAAVIERIG